MVCHRTKQPYIYSVAVYTQCQKNLLRRSWGRYAYLGVESAALKQHCFEKRLGTWSIWTQLLNSLKGTSFEQRLGTRNTRSRVFDSSNGTVF